MMFTAGEGTAGAVVVCAECSVCGGSVRVLDSLEVYDPVERRWSAGAALTTARCFHSCVVLEGKLWVVGGGDADHK